MRGRAIGLGLLALGAFLLAGALAVRLFLEPALVKLPLDQTAEPTAVGTGIEFFDLQAGEQHTGLEATVRQKVIGDPTAPGAGDDVAVWNFGSTVIDTDGNLLNAGTYRVCLDRRSAEAVECESDHVEYDRAAEIEGLTLTFPFGTEQRDYDVFSSATGTAFPATFEGAEEMGGLEVYRFQMSVPETVVESTEVPGALFDADEDLVAADVVYQNERTLWVEPTSGVIVTSEESPHTVLRGPGSELTLLSGSFAGTDETIAEGVQRAEDYREQISLVNNTVPLILAVAGLVLLLAGLLLLRRGSSPVRRSDDAVQVDGGAHRVPQAQ